MLNTDDKNHIDILNAFVDDIQPGSNCPEGIKQLAKAILLSHLEKCLHANPFAPDLPGGDF